ncbi:MAG: adenylate kinase [Chloroflexi bacterium]|nr:adenylate kinase [Chloroflexota bacterium]
MAVFVILLGAPGSGKGTQGDGMSKASGLPHIASGDLFREAMSKGTPLGRLAQSYMEKGVLVPDEVTSSMVLERLAQKDCAKGAILDGFPRTLEQARLLDDALAGRSGVTQHVFYIKVSDKELISRLAGRWICRDCQRPYHRVNSPPKIEYRCDACGGELYQRDDDSEETVKKRLKVYFAQTASLIDYYAQKGVLIEVDGEQRIGEVERVLMSKVMDLVGEGISKDQMING